MDEAEMTVILKEALRVYSFNKLTDTLGPFKKLLTGQPAIISVSLKNGALKVQESVPEIQPEYVAGLEQEIKAKEETIKDQKKQIKKLETELAQITTVESSGIEYSSRKRST